MKNQNIILSLSIIITCSFTSCNNSNENITNSKDFAQLEVDDHNITPGKTESEYYYGIGSRFAPISKTDLDSATTIFTFNNDDENARIEKVNSTEIIIIEKDRRTDKREFGNSVNLTDAQKSFFKSLDYSKHFSMKTLFVEKNIDGSISEEKKYNPHYTIVPETQAFYTEGEDALINYLIKNTKTETANLSNKKIRANKVYFTITKEGFVENVTMHFSTNYPELDTKLKELIVNMPGKWQPAKNAKGETMEQELTFTFGPKGGC